VGKLKEENTDDEEEKHIFLSNRSSRSIIINMSHWLRFCNIHFDVYINIIYNTLKIKNSTAPGLIISCVPY
jgi:hypothetical protein